MSRAVYRVGSMPWLGKELTTFNTITRNRKINQTKFALMPYE